MLRLKKIRRVLAQESAEHQLLQLSNQLAARSCVPPPPLYLHLYLRDPLQPSNPPRQRPLECIYSTKCSQPSIDYDAGKHNGRLLQHDRHRSDVRADHAQVQAHVPESPRVRRRRVVRPSQTQSISGCACKCIYELGWTCSGQDANCKDPTSDLCKNPDNSKAACEQGGGDCGGYTD